MDATVYHLPVKNNPAAPESGVSPDLGVLFAGASRYSETGIGLETLQDAGLFPALKAHTLRCVAAIAEASLP